MLDKIRRKILYTFPVELSTEKAYNKIVYIGRICRINYTHRRKKALTLTSLLLSVIMLFSLTIFAFAIPPYSGSRRVFVGNRSYIQAVPG